MGDREKFKVLFFVSAQGRCPAREFLDSLPPKVRGKLAKWIGFVKKTDMVPESEIEKAGNTMRDFEERISSGGISI
jgi:hypothetical protein